MAAKKVPKAQAGEDIKAYEIIQKRQINEDRILAERTSTFLLATAFLFVAFVMLLDPDWEGCTVTALQVLLPSVGLFLTLLLLLFNATAVRALGFWHDSQEGIEDVAGDKVFQYMNAGGIAPHSRKKNWLQKTLISTRTAYWCYLPLAFFVLWGLSLFWVLRN